MNALDPHRLDLLARQLALSPRALLVVAARLVDADATPARRRRVIADSAAQPERVAAVADLLATPIDSYARGHVLHALTALSALDADAS